MVSQAILSNLLLLVTSMGMASLVWRRGKAHPAAGYFLSLCVAAGLFSFTRILLAARPDPEEQLLWTRLGFLCAFSLLPILLDFPDRMLGTTKTTPRARWTVFALVAAFACLDFTPWMVRIGADGTVGRGGPALAAVWLTFAAIVVRFVWIFMEHRPRLTSEAEKNRGDWVVAGVAVFGATACLDMAQRLAILDIVPFLVAQWGVLCFMGCCAYAIVRHKLLEIELVLSRGLVYSGTTGAMALGFFLLTELTAQLGEKQLVPEHPMMAGFVAAVLAAVTFEPMKHLMQRAVDWVFFADRSSMERVARFRSLRAQVVERDRKGLLELRHELDEIIRECGGQGDNRQE